MAHEYRPAPMSLAQRAALRRQEPRTLRQPARRRVYPFVILLVIIVVVAVAVGGFEYLYRDRALPKVTVNTVNINVSGQTQDAIAAQLQPFAVTQTFRAIALIAPGKPTILLPAHKLGYSVDRGLTAWRAYSVGHTGSLLHRAKAQLTTLLNGATIDVVQRVDENALRNRLFALAPTVNRPARPGVAGRTLDVAAAQRQITRLLLHTTGGFKVYLPFTRIPALPAPAATHHPKQKHTHKTH